MPFDEKNLIVKWMAEWIARRLYFYRQF
jgi:hypothetical protein